MKTTDLNKAVDTLNSQAIFSPKEARQLIRDLGYNAVLDGSRSGFSFVRIYWTKEGDLKVQHTSASGFKAAFSNKWVKEKGEKRKSVGSFMLEDSDRPTYASVGFLPTSEDSGYGMLNIWQGFYHEPMAGYYPYFKELTWEIVCDKSKVMYEYVMDWLAHLVQRPWEKPGVCLVLQGKKGTGKDSWCNYLIEMLTGYAIKYQSGSQAIHRFNDELARSLLAVLSEGEGGSLKKAEDVMKNLITEPLLTTEKKNVDKDVKRSYVRLVVTSNEHWVVPASEDERRFAILPVSGDRRKDYGFFGNLYAEMRNGGVNALLHDLMNRDISNSNVRNAPESRGLVKQKIESLTGFNRFLYLCLDEGRSITDGEEYWPEYETQVTRYSVRKAYCEYAKIPESKCSPREIAKAMRDIGARDPEPDKGEQLTVKKQRCLMLPSIGIARLKFEEAMGSKIDWDDIEPVSSDSEAVKDARVSAEIEGEKKKVAEKEERKKKELEAERQDLIGQEKLGVKAWIQREARGDGDLEMFLMEKYSRANREKLLRRHGLC